MRLGVIIVPIVLVALFSSSAFGFVYFRNINTTGIADNQFFFGDPGDRLIAGNWIGTGEDSPADFRPGNRTVPMRYANT